MLPDVINDQDRNSLLFLIVSISPKAKESIELESYRATTDSDEATEEYILNDAFKNLLKDLEEIGLKIDIDTTEYTEDMGRLSSFIQLAMLLLPNSLYDIIKNDSQIRTLLEQILQGSLGGEESVVQTYLSELGGLDESPALRPHLSDLIDSLYPLVTQTPTFTDYLINLMDLHQQERPALIMDDERHATYRIFIREKIGLVSDAINRFETWDAFPKLLAVQNFFIRDLIAPDNFIPYAYIFLENKETLPEELYQGYLDKWRHYYVSHPWCFEYHKVRGRGDAIGEIAFEYRVLIACFLYAFGARDTASYQKRIAPLRRYYQDLEVDAIIASLFQE